MKQNKEVSTMQNDSSTDPISVPAANDTCPYSGIATSFNPFSEEYLANPYAFLAQARRSEPIFFSSMLNAWVVTRYDDVKAILHDPQRFSSVGNLEAAADYTPAALAILGTSQSVLTHTAVNVDPPPHTRIRASLSKAFSARQIARYEPLVRQLANQLIDQFISEGQVDIAQGFNYPFPALVIFHLMGIPEADFQQVLAWCCDCLELLYAKLPPERQIECAHSAVAYPRYIEALIEQRRAAPRDDLISELIRATDRGETHLTEEELLAQVMDLVLAGNETTSALLGNCLLHVLHDRSYWQTIREHPEVIHNIVEETLRFNGSALPSFRTTTEAVQLAGVALPKGAHVFVVLSSANRDEAQFPDPDVFNPQRQNLGRHMGLGSGIHFCLGAPLARLEARVALEALSTRLPSLRLVPNQELSYKRSVPLRALRQLLVEWDVD
jgi:cytochrome P450